jgi:hypothetical protein
MTYCDPTTGEYVGEFERPCLMNAGEIHRDTEWFSSASEARRFARTGIREPSAKPTA